MRYIDIPSVMQVIGAVYNNPSLLDNEKYFFSESDFTEQFHKILFGSIYNLYQLGATSITNIDIRQYLESRPVQLGIYEANKGDEYLQKLAEDTQIAAFDYYYNRVKKMTLLRVYKEKAGMDLKWLYDIDNILDIKKKQAQEDWLDSTPIEDIADLIDKKILDIRVKYINNSNNNFTQAGQGARTLIEKLRDIPDFGYPLFGSFVNAIFRGARLGKFYLRSASTGVGKTRSMIADACNFACNILYDITQKCWVTNGTKEPTLYIATEQDMEEIQTMMIAFIADVNEDHIRENLYIEDEYDRVLKATEILEESPLYVKYLPDFALQDVENSIKYAIREWKVKYCCFDYIHSSLKILGEVSAKAGIKNLREDNILFMLAARLKDLANEYGIFILSATQLNGTFKDSDIQDQTMLRGSKAVADRIDAGAIMLDVTQKDIEKLQPLLAKAGYEVPTIKMSIYKNRGNRWKNIILWCRDRRGVCKIEPIFATNYNHELVSIEDVKITVKPKTVELPKEKKIPKYDF